MRAKVVSAEIVSAKIVSAEMTMRTRWIALSLVAALAACKEATPVTPPTPAVEGALQLAPSAEMFDHGGAATRFDLGALRELWVRVKVPRLEQTTAVKLVFIDKLGQPFYEDNAAYALQASTQGMNPGNGGVQLNVHAATVVPGGYALDRPIAIAGSVFQRHPSYGMWRVEATVTGLATKLTSPLEFVRPQ